MVHTHTHTSRQAYTHFHSILKWAGDSCHRKRKQDRMRVRIEGILFQNRSTNHAKLDSLTLNQLQSWIIEVKLSHVLVCNHTQLASGRGNFEKRGERDPLLREKYERTKDKVNDLLWLPLVLKWSSLFPLSLRSVPPSCDALNTHMKHKKKKKKQEKEKEKQGEKQTMPLQL